MRFGTPRLHFRETDSTNERAKQLALGGAPGGAVVTADSQTAGRGRQGRSWHADRGGSLLYSAILRPLAREHALLPLAAPLAVCDVARGLAGLECQVKWPNDVLTGEGRKLAGILIEARPGDEWAVIGVGLNVALDEEQLPGELRGAVASLGEGVGIDQARDALDRALGEWVDAPADRVLETYRQRDALAGREIEWEEGRGTALGVAPDGNLRVRLVGGEEVALGAGEVHLGRGGLR